MDCGAGGPFAKIFYRFSSVRHRLCAGGAASVRVKFEFLRQKKIRIPPLPLQVRGHVAVEYVLGEHGLVRRGTEEHVPLRTSEPGRFPAGVLRCVLHDELFGCEGVEQQDQTRALASAGAEHGVLR